MQLKLAFVAASLTTLAGATDFPPASDCPVGPIQCCATVEDVAQAASSSTTLEVLSIIGVDISSLYGLIGLTCYPIGPYSGSCDSQALCCTGPSTIEGLISIGCTPVTLGI
ncbi:hypothetical protein BDP27DRAFT_1236862 [Rhodocollybia butyracea]|uniref:Hydrophobin n=1 Tax=Rhodocollybia butyracea TaxID=206335 RepID=A0A9P5PBJ7_9AGAR|nr:hypothetical protein BDP27DRAFT_1236862 [Rhodocollybia butyracea]